MPLEQAGGGRPRHQVRAGEVHLEDPAEGVDVVRLRSLPDRRDARSVDDDGWRAEALGQLEDRLLARRLVGHVGLEREPALADQPGDLLALPARARRDAYAGSLRGKAERDPAADPAPATGDEADPVLEAGSRHGSRIWLSFAMTSSFRSALRAVRRY